jgi:hypothetical protein
MRLALAVLPSFLALAVCARADDVKTGPPYNTAKVVSVTAIVTEVRDVQTGPLDGIHLTVKVNGEPIRVYVAPAAFVKTFGVTFKKNDVIEITGSKVTFEDSPLILAREITQFRTDIMLRDASGKPYWLNSEPPSSR